MMGFPVQNEGTTSFQYSLIIEGHQEAFMRKYKQSVHSRLCGNDMETSRGASAEIRGRSPETHMSGKELNYHLFTKSFCVYLLQWIASCV